MKKIIRWLKPSEKTFEPYFRRDGHGRDVYYPWGYVGDAYYVTKHQKIVLKASYFTCAIVYFLFFFWFDAKFSDAPLFGAAVLFGNIGLFLWLSFLYFYQKGLRDFKLEKRSNKGMQRQPRLIRELFVFTAIQILVILSGFVVDPSDPLLRIAIVCIILFYPLSIWFVWRRQGYIFQKKPPSIQ